MRYRNGRTGKVRVATAEPWAAPMGAAETCGTGRGTPAEVLETSWDISDLFFLLFFKALVEARRKVFRLVLG